ncbi:MAG: hypothetical protein MST00_05105 [Tenericutes bacterium]|nr:hypothetical protein [Mycoplasmatota bacterium]
MNKVEIFSVEINYIKNADLKESLKLIVDKLPDYFFYEAASSTGKYHPKYALGDGGLLRHSKAATKIGLELLNNPLIGSKYSPREKDMLLLSLLVHDGLKRGLTEEKYTRVDHPILMANFILDNYQTFKLNLEDAKFISDVIKTHMGPYNTDFNGNVVLETPKNKYQSFVHMCDYLASRKCLEVPFDENNNIID